MEKPIKILTVFGTRPEAIKMAPLVKAFAEDASFSPVLCVTGQHREMLDQVLDLFQISPDFDLNVMKENQSLNGLTSRIFSGIDSVIEKVSPDWVLVHGDTTTSMAVALAAFHRQVRVAHVEAGLRTHDLKRPWPEEMNRRVVDIFADLLLAPTQKSKENLELERRERKNIIITGNTVIDSLNWVVGRLKNEPLLEASIAEACPKLDSTKRTLLVTGHRRENFGQGFIEICNAISKLAERKDLQIVYPVHLNPNVKGPVLGMLGNKSNVHLIEPLEYPSFVWMLQKCDMVLTDSGGVQEEAPTLGKPVLVMRDVTERPEAVLAGTVELVGASAGNIYDRASRIFDDPAAYRSFARAHNPYGDGHAVARILKALKGEKVDEFVCP